MQPPPEMFCQSTIAAYKSARGKRYRLRQVAANLIGGRTRKCGCTRLSSHVEIWKIRERSEYRGLVTCGSIWACPVCAGKIAYRRGEDVARLIVTHELATLPSDVQDHTETASVFMATLTVRHGPWQSAAQLREAVVAAWRGVQQGRVWNDLKAEFGILGTIRALEVTHGRHGWHPHLHILLLTRQLDREEQDALQQRLCDRWQHVIARDGATANHRGQDFRICRGASGAAQYIAKWGAGCEVGKGEAKRGRRGSRSPWQLLKAYDNGDRQAGSLFHDYATAFKGARHLTWSRGLRQYYGLDDDCSDEDLAAQSEMIVDPAEADIQPRCTAKIFKEAWSCVVAKNLQHEVQVAAEIGGQTAVDLTLKRYGIENRTDRWVPPDRPWRPFILSKCERLQREMRAFHRSRPGITAKLQQTEVRKSCHC